MENQSKLEQLRNLVSEMFKQAEDKQSIEQLSVINNSINEVQKEQDQLVEKNAELIKSYKDLVQHTSFNDTAKKPVDQIGGIAPSFEEALAQFMKNKEN